MDKSDLNFDVSLTMCVAEDDNNCSICRQFVFKEIDVYRLVDTITTLGFTFGFDAITEVKLSKFDCLLF